MTRLARANGNIKIGMLLLQGCTIDQPRRGITLRSRAGGRLREPRCSLRTTLRSVHCDTRSRLLRKRLRRRPMHLAKNSVFDEKRPNPRLKLIPRW